jgi:hypothetical protein
LSFKPTNNVMPSQVLSARPTPPPGGG